MNGDTRRRRRKLVDSSFIHALLRSSERKKENRRNHSFCSSWSPPYLPSTYFRSSLLPCFFPHFSFVKMKGITHFFLSYFLAPLLIRKTTHIFSFFFARSSFFRNGKGNWKRGKTGIASFFRFSSLPWFSPFFSLSIFRFWNGERKREFISSRFHFSFLLGNETENSAFFSSFLTFFFGNGGGNEKEEVSSFSLFFLKEGEKKSWIFQANILLRIF